jgi:hypothetical protein
MEYLTNTKSELRNKSHDHGISDKYKIMASRRIEP